MAGVVASPLRRSPGATALVGLGAVVAAALLGALTWDGEHVVIPIAWLLAAVVAGSLTAGLQGGLAASFTGTAVLLLVFTDPRWSLRADEAAEARATAAFAAVALLVVLAIDLVDGARRRADAALAEQERVLVLLDGLLDHAPVGIAFFDADLRFVRVNEELLRLNGLPVEDHLGRRIDEVLRDPAVARSAAAVLESGRAVVDVPFDARHRATGEPLHVLASYYPVAGPDGDVAGVGAVVRDVTREARAEAERTRLVDRFRRLQAATAALARARTTDEVAGAVLAEVPAATRASAVSLSLVDGDHLRVVSSDGYGDAALQRWRTFPVGAGVPIAESVRAGTIVTAGSREEIVARWPAVADDLAPGKRSLAAIPLSVGGEVIGAIGLSFDGPLPDEDGTSFLEAIASQASQALRRATLAESDRVSREHLAFLADATVALTASLDLDLTLSRLADLAVPRLGDWCAVHLVEPGGIRPLALAHVDGERLEALQRLVDRWPIDLAAARGTGAVIRTGAPELYEELSPALLEAAASDDEHLRAIEEAGFTSGLVVPLQAKGRTLGALALGTSGDRRVGPAELELAREVAARAGQAMLNAELFRERTHIADVLQRSLLPPDEISVPGLDVAARFVPVGVGIDVGGDFYDAFRLGPAHEPSSSHAVVVGDVCGKGSEAAALAGAARHTIRAAGLRSTSPSAMLRELNEVLLVLGTDADTRTPRFCTVVVAVVTPTETGARVTLAAAGHPLPVLQARDGTARPVGQAGTLVGVVDDPLLHDVEVELTAGEALILYTDGVTERHAGDRFFDEEGLAAAVSRCAGFTAEAMAERIELAARAFVEDEPRDDLAIVVLRVPGRTGTSSSASTELPVDASAPRLARRFVSEVLAALGRDDLAGDGALLASEIVTNAVLHGEPPLRVSVEPATDRVRVAVTDAGQGRPELVALDDPTSHGKGLQLVDRVAERWGVDGLPTGGKSVWFELA